MHPSTAQHLLNIASAGPLPKTVAAAEALILVWLRDEAAVGKYTEDAYGNFIWTDKQGTRRRWHLAKQVLQEQAKHAANLGGAWYNVRSYPMIDMALALFEAAAKHFPDPEGAEVLEKASAARGKRAASKETRRSKKEEADFRASAREWATRKVIWENWKESYPLIMQGVEFSPERFQEMREDIQVYEDDYKENPRPVPDGMTPAGEQALASLDRPPLPPFQYAQNYIWAQEEPTSGKTFSVRVDHVHRGEVRVQIGKRDGMLEVTERGTIGLQPARLLGDAYGLGYIKIADDKSLDAELTMGFANPAIVAIWKALVRGYGSPL